jgi:beta-lactamase class A
MVDRRTLLTLPFALLAGCATSGHRAGAVQASIERIRARVGGRIGVHALDTASGRRFGFDDDSRYATASTFKLLLAAAILAEVDAGRLSLDHEVPVSVKDLVTYSPTTEPLVPRGAVAVRVLLKAVIELSDNTAANLLLALIGGPQGYTKYLRGLGDTETRLDRMETALNSNIAGDPRDTTTPRAMVTSMSRVLLEDALAQTSTDLLIGWLIGSQTGLERIRAGLPKDWRVGDKTGSGANGAVNDLAIFWPPNRMPVLLAIYMSESTRSTAELNAAHADITRTLVSEGL